MGYCCVACEVNAILEHFCNVKYSCVKISSHANWVLLLQVLYITLFLLANNQHEAITDVRLNIVDSYNFSSL